MTSKADEISLAVTGNQPHLWLLRMLVLLGGHRHLVEGNALWSHEHSVELGIEQWHDNTPEQPIAKLVLAKLQKDLAEAEMSAGRVAVYPPVLQRNLERLSQVFGLNEIDRQVIAFWVTLQNDQLLINTTLFLNRLSTTKVLYVISVLINQPEGIVRQTLSINGNLASTGLLRLNYSAPFLLADKIYSPVNNFAEHLMHQDEECIVKLFRDIATYAPAPLLESRHFAHMGKQLYILKSYLHQALDAKRQGVNILVYGPSGTGKTQLVRLLAKEVAAELLEVDHQNERWDKNEVGSNMLAFHLSQGLASARRSLILIDEADDVFSVVRAWVGYQATAQNRKAAIKAIMRRSSVPSIWIVNSATGIDPAIILSFDVILKVAIPPRQWREQLLWLACNGNGFI